MASILSGRNRILALAVAAAVAVAIVVVVVLLLSGDTGGSPETLSQTAPTAMPDTEPGRTPSTPSLPTPSTGTRVEGTDAQQPSISQTAAASSQATRVPAVTASTPSVASSQSTAEDPPWVTDGVNDLERSATASLEAIEEIDPSVAKAVKLLPWLGDEVLLEERLALISIQEIADKDRELADSVVNLPWLSEAIIDNELLAINSIRDLALQDPTLAKDLVGTHWVADGISEEERFVVAVLQELAAEDPSMARRMLEFPDIADGLSKEELATFTGAQNYFLERIERGYPAIAETIRGYSWISGRALGDGHRSPSGLLASPLTTGHFTTIEQWGLFHIKRIANIDAALAERIVELPWISDGITSIENRALIWIGDMAQEDPTFAHELLGFSWVADGVTKSEESSMLTLDRLVQHGQEEARELFDQPWLPDELTDEEQALIETLKVACSWSSWYRELIESGQVRSGSVLLSSGEVGLFVVSRFPLGPETDALLSEMGSSLEMLHDLIGLPWTRPRLIVYLEPGFPSERDILGRYVFGNYIMLNTQQWDPWFIGVLSHEIGHYYFKYPFPHWLEEGGANFFADYTLHRRENVDLQLLYTQAHDQTERTCGRFDISNIEELQQGLANLPYADYRNSPLGGCSYPIGERFLLGMYMGLGQSVIAASVRELYGARSKSLGQLSEKRIYQALYCNTPPELHNDFKDLYRRLHGGPIPADTEISQCAAPTPPPAAKQPQQPAPTQVLGSPAEDRTALVALYNSTGGTNWKNKHNWLTDVPVDQWYGVTTDSDGRVTEINLRESRLAGPIPAELGRLSQLKVLDLGNSSYTCNFGTDCNPSSPTANRLTGPLPYTLGNLKGLVGLDLQANQVTGGIPAWLGNLSNLRWLILSANPLSGAIPSELGQLNNLEILLLHNDELSGAIPESLGNLTNLTRLDIRGAGITGQLPVYLTNLTNLEWLVLGHGLTGPLPAEIGSLRKLRHLSLGVNNLTGPVPSQIGRLSSLEGLFLNNNQFTGSIPVELGNLMNLKWLALDGNQLVGEVPAELAGLSKLTVLLLSYNELSGCVPISLGTVETNDLGEVGLPSCR